MFESEYFIDDNTAIGYKRGGMDASLPADIAAALWRRKMKKYLATLYRRLLIFVIILLGLMFWVAA